ncbi:MAG TPA: HD domain-containing protein [Firmicutes bacterium]|nr:HD domain-containing protein [Bacillota bacterium]
MEAEREAGRPSPYTRWGIRWRLTAFLVVILIFLALSVTTLVLVRQTLVANGRERLLVYARALSHRLEVLRSEGEALVLPPDPDVGQIVVLDGTGTVVTDHRFRLGNSPAPPLVEKPALGRLRAAAGRANEGTYFTSAADGSRWLVAFAQTSQSGALVAAGVPLTALFRSFALFMRGWLLVSAVTVLALFLLVLFFVDRLLLPIERLFCLTREASPVMNTETETAAAEDLLVLTRSVNRLMAYIEAFPGVLNLMLGLKDGYTSHHTRKVARYAVEIGKALGLNDRQLGELECAALLHDIGKAGVPDLVLKKPGSLNDEEWASIRLHPVLGAEVAAEAGFTPAITLAIRQHHERLDGSGYPDRLKEGAIGLYARIIAAADTYHAMTSDRPYRPARSAGEAQAELLNGAGPKYDSRVVQAFLSVLNGTDAPAGRKEADEAKASISSPSRA